MGALIFIGIIYIIYKVWEERRWDNGSADNVDWSKMSKDTTRMNMGEISRRQLRENYRSGKYNK